MNDFKKTLLFSFGNQKGGVGKSTLTTLFGNYVHFTHHPKYDYAGVDGDDLQRTLFSFRCRDLEIKKQDFASEEQLNDAVWAKEDEYGLYHIVQVPSKDFQDSFFEDLDKTVHFMAIDLPGNLKQEGVMEAYVPVDVLFVPCNPNDIEIDSTLEFLKIYKGVDELRVEAGYEPAQKYLILSRIDRKLPFDKDKFKQRFAEHADLKFLEYYFPYTPAAYGRDINTLLQFKKNGSDAESSKLFNEIFQILENTFLKINA